MASVAATSELIIPRPRTLDGFVSEHLDSRRQRQTSVDPFVADCNRRLASPPEPSSAQSGSEPARGAAGAEASVLEPAASGAEEAAAPPAPSDERQVHVQGGEDAGPETTGESRDSESRV